MSSSKNQTLLGLYFNKKLCFDNVTLLYTRKPQKIQILLSKLFHYKNLAQRIFIMNRFTNSQCSYCSLVWMFHSKKLNTHIDNLGPQITIPKRSPPRQPGYFYPLFSWKNSFSIYKFILLWIRLKKQDTSFVRVKHSQTDVG